MMKKALFAVAILISFVCQSQTNTGDRVIARQSLYLRDRWVDTVKNTITGSRNAQRSILTAKAANDLVDSASYREVLGTIYNASTWSNLSGFTINGAGTTPFVSVVSNKIKFANDSGAVDFSKSLSYNYVTGLERSTARYYIKIDQKTSTTTGFAVGIKSINSTGGAYQVSQQIKFDMTSGANTGRLSLWQSGVKIDSSSGQLTFSSGDEIVLEVNRDLNDLNITVFNRTTTSVRIQLLHKYIGGEGPPNAGYFTIWQLNGGFTVNSINLFSLQPKHADIFVLGDSRTGTYLLEEYNQRFPARMNNYFGATLCHSGNGDKTAEMLAVVPEVIALAPQYVWFVGGLNDINTGVSFGTYTANIDSIYARLTRAGIIVRMSVIRGALTDQTALINWETTNHAADYIDCFTPLAECAGCYSDGTHLASLGHEKVYNAAILSGKFLSDFRVLSKTEVYPDGMPKAIKEGGNAFGRSFSIGSNDNNDVRFMRNKSVIAELRAVNTLVPAFFLPDNGLGQNGFYYDLNGVTFQSARYNTPGEHTKVFNIAIADSTTSRISGLRFAHFNQYGTDDFLMYMMCHEGFRANAYGSFLFTGWGKGGRIGTYGNNNMPLWFDINLVNKMKLTDSLLKREGYEQIKDIGYTPPVPPTGYLNIFNQGDSLWAQNHAGGLVNLTRPGSGGGGGGSGTVNAGNQYRIAYYASTGTAVSEAAAIAASRALISDANGVPIHSATTSTELGYVSGVTGAIQTQIDGKQATDGDLTALAALSGTGIARRTGTNTWTVGTGITNSEVTDVAWSKITSTPTTLSGYGITDGQPLDGDLTALAALSGTGVARRTGSNTWSVGTTVSIAEGGTGQTTANAALNALLPSQTSNSGKFLQTDGTNTSWVTGASGVSSVGTINSQTKSANGAVVSGSNLVLQTVDATYPGLMTSAQKQRLDSSYYIVTPVTGVQVAYQVSVDTLRIKSLVGSTNISVTNNGDTTNTVAITGDIPFSNITQGSALSVLGVSGNATADVASIAAGSDNQVLRRSGTSIGFGSIDLSQSNTVGSSILGSGNGGTGNAFFAVSGPASSTKTVTFPNQNGTVAYASGVSGGQNITGGTAANNTLSLTANSAASGNTGTNTAVTIFVGNSGSTTAVSWDHNGKTTFGGAVDFNGQTITNYSANFNAQSGTSYTLTSSDNGKIITMTNASAITLTVPTGLPIGFNCSVVQMGAGAITFTASSTTINNRGSNTKTAGQYAVASIFCYGTNSFVTGGDMVP